MIKLKIDSQLTINGLNGYQVDKLEKLLSIPNPTYKKMYQMGNFRALHSVSQFIEYFEKPYPDTLVCGRGTREWIEPWLRSQKEVYNVDDTTVEIPLETPVTSKIELREYQKKPFDEIRKESGILKLGTGFGKSVIALKLIERIQQKTLIIVPRGHLLKQYVKDIETFMPDVRVSVIQAQKKDVSGDVVIGTIQTLSNMAKREEISGIGKSFGCVIVDECHQFVTEKRLKVIHSFSPRYLYGMTATPERSDEQCDAIKFTFGKILIDYELPQEKPDVKVYFSNVVIPPKDYHLVIDDQVENEDRNAFIAELVEKQVKQGRRLLVLTKRIIHAQRIMEMLSFKRGVYEIHSQMSDDERNELLSAFRKNTKKYKVIFGTYALLGTGSDIPSLDTLMLAGDLKSKVLQKQSVGRVLRLFDDKKNPRVIDIADHMNPFLSRQHRERTKLYKENGWDVEYKNKRIKQNKAGVSDRQIEMWLKKGDGKVEKSN